MFAVAFVAVTASLVVAEELVVSLVVVSLVGVSLVAVSLVVSDAGAMVAGVVSAVGAAVSDAVVGATAPVALGRAVGYCWSCVRRFDFVCVRCSRSHDKSKSRKESDGSAQAPCFCFDKARFCNNGFFKVFHNFIPIFLFFSDGLDDSHNHLDLVFTVPTCKDKK